MVQSTFPILSFNQQNGDPTTTVSYNGSSANNALIWAVYVPT